VSAGKRSADDRAAKAIAQRSAASFRLFGWLFERTFKNCFHAARIAHPRPPAAAPTQRIVIYSNHPSWWDGVTYALVARYLYPRHRAYTPIDAAMLDHYGFVGKIGAFGVAQNSKRGAADFIAGSKAVLELGDGLLIVAAQGRFADPRERPLACAAGVAHLPDHVPDVTFIPLAIEYPLWSEKQPELLLQFGDGIDGNELAALPVAERREKLEAALEGAMDRLAALSIARDAKAFDIWIEGTMGVNPLYDGWRRLRAKVRGTRFNAEHGAPE
jgi:1-acyl-sn-glycerol-3-phosphate acyltransferase